MCLLCLILQNVTACAGLGQAASVVSATAGTALVAHKFCLFDSWCEEKTLFTQECSWATEHEFTDEAIAGMDEEDLNWAVSHNEKVKKFCDHSN